MAAPHALVGRTLGPFRIEASVSGHFLGDLLRATDLALDRPALVLRVGLLDGVPPESALAVLEAPLRPLADLRHPRVCELYHVDVLDGAPAMVFESPAGEPLSSLLSAGPFEVRRATSLVRDVLQALACAQQVGVLHGALRPEDVWVAAEEGRERARLFGLGLAGVLGALRRAGLASHDVVPGDPRFLAPEILRGERRVGPPADVYGAGALLYAALAGRPPFDGTEAEVAAAVTALAPRPLRSRRFDASPELAEAIARSLAKDPEHRFPDATSFARALLGPAAEPAVFSGGETLEQAAADEGELGGAPLRAAATSREAAVPPPPPVTPASPDSRAPFHGNEQRTVLAVDGPEDAVETAHLEVEGARTLDVEGPGGGTTLPAAAPGGEATLPAGPPSEATLPPRQDACEDAPTALPSPAEQAFAALEGHLVAGKYRVLQRLAEGPAGARFLARHELLGSPVELSVLRASYSVRVDVRERWLGEARAAFDLLHRSVVAVRDSGLSEEGLLYRVSDVPAGRSLRSVLDAEGPLAWRRGLLVARATLVALDVGHSQGVSHGSLDAGCVFLEADPAGGDVVRLAGFGVVRAEGAVAPATGALAARGTSQDDVRAWARVLGESLVKDAAGGAPLAPRVAGLPAAVDALLDRALSASPPPAGEVLAALDAVLAEAATEAPAVLAPTAPVPRARAPVPVALCALSATALAALGVLGIVAALLFGAGPALGDRFPRLAQTWPVIFSRRQTPPREAPSPRPSASPSPASLASPSPTPALLPSAPPPVAPSAPPSAPSPSPPSPSPAPSPGPSASPSPEPSARVAPTATASPAPSRSPAPLRPSGVPPPPPKPPDGPAPTPRATFPPPPTPTPEPRRPFDDGPRPTRGPPPATPAPVRPTPAVDEPSPSPEASRVPRARAPASAQLADHALPGKVGTTKLVKVARREAAPFWIEERPVTLALYAAFLRAARAGAPLEGQDRAWETLLPKGSQGPRLQDAVLGRAALPDETLEDPVEGVSHDDAVAYAAWARLRLPTDAEWLTAASWDAKAARFAPPAKGEPSPCGAVELDGTRPELVEASYSEGEVGKVVVRNDAGSRRGAYPATKVAGATFRCVRDR